MTPGAGMQLDLRELGDPGARWPAKAHYRNCSSSAPTLTPERGGSVPASKAERPLWVSKAVLCCRRLGYVVFWVRL
jgi:hypothetical protein